ncbi:hypothetical protein ZWY2020_040595 [Hordeum vulgare]|nr:hypothetical protein ZWY2020_040595 [Hordeum vulgare]
MRSDGGYLALFQKVVEALEAGVSHMEEDSVSSARELLGLALTLVFSNLRRLVPDLDLQRVVEPVHVASRHPLQDEVRPLVGALVERYLQVPASSEEEDSNAEPARAMGDIGSPSP